MSETNCPNCGAVVDYRVDECPYCHSPYHNLTFIDVDNVGCQTTIIKINSGGQTYLRKVVLASASITHSLSERSTFSIEFIDVGGPV